MKYSTVNPLFVGLLVVTLCAAFLISSWFLLLAVLLILVSAGITGKK